MTDATAVSFTTYEQQLDSDPEWALAEGSRHFDQQNSVYRTLNRICRRLSELQIPYAVVGGLALFQHGYRRFTEDVDLLVTEDGLERIHSELEGRGYLPPFAHSKNLRDTETGVRIEFLIAGQYPGDGKPKPVAFPNPADASVELDGLCYLQLTKLIELKLASGMTNRHRGQDLVDVQNLIEVLDLPRNFGDQLDPYVRTKFGELWDVARGISSRYLRAWPIVISASGISSLDDLIVRLRAASDDAVEELDAMRRAGVTLAPEAAPGEHEIWLLTTDPDVARKYDMHEESEFRGLDSSSPEKPGTGDPSPLNERER